VDILCSNAGIASAIRPLTEVPADYVRWSFEVNVMATLHAIQAVIPGMVARKSGQFMITGSFASFCTGGGLVDYSMAKHAVLALADGLRKETAEAGIGVSVLCPSAVKTGLGENTRSQMSAEMASALKVEADAAARDRRRFALLESTGGFMSPDVAAEIALAGLSRGQFLIFTHPESREQVLARCAEISAGFDAIPELLG